MPNYPTSFSWKARLKSFTYAWAGLKQLFSTEHNSWLHLGVTLLVAVLGFVFHISNYEWIAVLIVMALVWMAELFNTCLEKTMDFLSGEIHPQIKIIKDMAAAAVLITALMAVVVGCLIFLPKIFLL